MRLYKYGEPAMRRAQWIPLREKQHCYANLSSLGLADRELEKHITGAICFSVQYELLPEGKPLPATNGATDESVARRASLLARGIRSLSLPTVLPSALSDSDVDDDGFDSKSLANLPSSCDFNGDYSPHASHPKSNKGHSVDAGAGAGAGASASAGASVRASTDAEEIIKVQSELSSSREIHYLAKKISGWVLTEGDYQVVQNLLNGLAGFGQGIEVGRVALTIAYLLIQRYYRSLPMEFSNNIVLTKDDLELPRVIFKYAYAAHGWPALYFFGKRNEVFSDVVGTDSNYRAVMQFLQLDPNDMLVCDLDQHRLFRPNFYVVLDRRLSAVILSIRGTMSLRDTLTDLSFDYIPWNGGIVHSGIMTSAKWFLDNVGRQLCLFAEEYQMSRIILTGHSLGGATAALATIMLTEELEGGRGRGGKGKDNSGDSWPVTVGGQRIDIHCYTYGTPPILSPDLAAKYTHLIDTFVYGDDIVPRLSYGTMADLQILMVYAAEMGRASDMFSSMEGSELQKSLGVCQAAIRAGNKVENPKLHVPGRVHHMMTIKAPHDRTYTVIDTCGAERFGEMTLRKGMLTHHLPSKYELAFENAYVTYLLHELEERQTGAPTPPLTMRDKMDSVLSLLRTDGAGTGGAFGIPMGMASGSGLFFPRSSKEDLATDRQENEHVIIGAPVDGKLVDDTVSDTADGTVDGDPSITTTNTNGGSSR